MNNFTFKLDGETGEPLYKQLYSYLLREICRGNLKENEKLPSKRELSAHLHISQNTIDTAYQMLVSEGYVTARARSGFYVCRLDYQGIGTLFSEPDFHAPGERDSKKADSEIYEYDFSTNTVDTEAFPYATWLKLTKEVMTSNPELLHHGDARGDECLRVALTKYLHEFRGIHCSPEQLIIGAGMEYLLGLVAELLDDNSVFALEDPGYYKVYGILKNCGRKINGISLDENGILPQKLNWSNSDVVYITPSHQFPTGTVMPAGRRMEILNWANREEGRYIIEDDYDSEFRFNGRPIPSLQGMDTNDKVLYIGTFSRSIAPSVRIAYLVLPRPLSERYRQSFGFYSSTVSRFEQHTLYRFIENGHYGRHINRMRSLYKKRKDALVSALKASELGDKIKISGENAGLHFLMQVNNGMTEAELVEAARRHGVCIKGLSAYKLSEDVYLPDNTVTVGYSALRQNQIEGAVKRLCEAWCGNHV